MAGMQAIDDASSEMQKMHQTVLQLAALLRPEDLSEDQQRSAEIFLENDAEETFFVWSEIRYPLLFYLKRNNEQSIIFGSLPTPVSLRILVDTMATVYLPMLQQNTHQEEYFNKEMTLCAYRFLAVMDCLDRRFRKQPFQLYIPPPWMCSKFNQAQCEGLLLEWEQQLRWLDQSGEDRSDEGLTEEMRYWRMRRCDLLQLQEQLNSEVVNRMQKELSHSVFLPKMLTIRRRVEEQLTETKSTVTFLAILEGPCNDLRQTEHDCSLFARLIMAVRIVWLHCPQYHLHEDRITVIFRKVTLEVIRSCSERVPVNKIFQGYIQSGRSQLKKVLTSCELWKDTYWKVSEALNTNTQPWCLTEKKIFLQMNIFIQHLRDLLQVCSACYHFGGWQEGEQRALPILGGRRGVQVTSQMMSMRARFGRALSQLEKVSASSLDVHSTNWHQSFQRFEVERRQLEVSTLSILSSGFIGIDSVKESLEFLSLFRHLTDCPPVQMAMQEMTVRMYSIFARELDEIGGELFLPVRLNEPSMAGRVMRANALKARIDSTAKLLGRAAWLPDCNEGEALRKQCQEVSAEIRLFQSSLHRQWLASLEKDRQGLVSDTPLFRRSLLLPTTIEVNVDRRMIQHAQEIEYWHKLSFHVPVVPVAASTELQCQCRMLVQQYNRIVAWLSAEERFLFQQLLKESDKQLLSGFTSCTWMSPDANNYLSACQTVLQKVHKYIYGFKSNNAFVRKECKKLQELSWFQMEQTAAESTISWKNRQEIHRQKCMKEVEEILCSIQESIDTTFRYLTGRQGTEESTLLLKDYTTQVKTLSESSSFSGIVSSLQALKAALCRPMLVTHVTLIDKAPCMSPSYDDICELIKDAVTLVCNTHLHQCTMEPRWEKLYGEHWDRIQKVMNRVEKTVHAHFHSWEPYKHLWEIDLANLKSTCGHPAVASIVRDITCYKIAKHKLQQKRMWYRLGFVLVDSSELVVKTQEICRNWLTMLESLLSCHILNAAKDLLNRQVQIHDIVKKLL